MIEIQDRVPKPDRPPSTRASENTRRGLFGLTQAQLSAPEVRQIQPPYWDQETLRSSLETWTPQLLITGLCQEPL